MIDINNFLSFQVHGSAGAGHKASDGVAGMVEQFLTFIESLMKLSSGEIFTLIMPGFSAMANIHPLVVHFPIALIISFFIIDLVGSLFDSEGWRKLATGLLYLGTISAGVTVAVGFMAAGSVEHGDSVHLIMMKHKYFGISILSLSIFLSLWRLLSGGAIKGAMNIIFLMFAAILNVLIILGADLGGLMVYKHGVAVEAVKVNSIDYFHEHTHSH